MMQQAARHLFASVVHQHIKEHAKRGNGEIFVVQRFQGHGRDDKISILYRSGYFAVTGNAIISAILPSLYDLQTLRLLYSSILQFLDLHFRRHFVLNFKKNSSENPGSVGFELRTSNRYY